MMDILILPHSTCGAYQLGWNGLDENIRMPVERIFRAMSFDVEAPDRIWVTDITLIRTLKGFACLAGRNRRHSRCVVGWSMRSRQTADLVLQVLHMAIWWRKPKGRVLID